MCGRPARQVGQWPHGSSGLTTTGVPAARSAVGSASVPLISCPSTRPGRARACSPATMCRSVPQSPVYATSTRTQPARGSGRGRSTAPSRPGPSQRSALMIPLDSLITGWSGAVMRRPSRGCSRGSAGRPRGAPGRPPARPTVLSATNDSSEYQAACGVTTTRACSASRRPTSSGGSVSSTSSPAPARRPPSRASSRAAPSTSPPRAVLTSTAPGLAAARNAASTRCRVCSVRPRCREITSLVATSSSSPTSRTPSPGRPGAGSAATTSMPKAAARRATADPIAPAPTTPKRSVDSRRSGRATRYSQLPARTDAASTGRPRSSVSVRARAWSATSCVP